MQEDVKVDRWRFIGGSDVSAIMGISSFKTRWQLLQEKASEEDTDLNLDEIPEVHYGNVMEPKIRAYLNITRGLDLKEDRVVVEDESEVINIRYHDDGFDSANETVCEIKTTSKIHEEARDYKYYVVQLLTGMMCRGVTHGLLAVYERPKNFDMEFDEDRIQVFEIELPDYADWANEIALAIEDFRTDLKFLKLNPDATEEQLPSRTNLVPLANKLLSLESSIAEYKRLTEEYDAMKAKLYELMHEQGIKSWRTDNGTLFTMVLPVSESVVYKMDEKKFKEDHPKLWQKYAEPKLKAGRKGYVKITTTKES